MQVMTLDYMGHDQVYLLTLHPNSNANLSLGASTFMTDFTCLYQFLKVT